MKFWKWRKQRQQRESDLERELRGHLELEAEERREAGLPPQEAAYAARRALGNTTQIKEDVRTAWGFQWLETLLQDLRYGLRQLRHNPGFSAVAILTLALAIGANTAIFTILNGVLLRAFPYRDPSRLVLVFWKNPAWGQDRIPLCVADFNDWKASNHAFDQPVVFGRDQYDFTGGQEPQRILGAKVSPGFFSALGVEPALGRSFVAEEEKPGGRLAVIVSRDFWINDLGARPDAVGANITLNDQSYTVVGVMPGSFRFPAEGVKLWEPLRLEPPTRRAPYSLRGLARLRPGVSLEQARADMASVNQRIRDETHSKDSGGGFNVLPLRTYLVGDVRPVLLVLMAAASFVLLIAVANLANLMLVRSVERQKELAVRTALGAGRPRIVRQLLTEGLVLTATGAGLGLVFAYACVNLLISTGWVELPRLTEISIDGHVLEFTLLITILSSLIFTLAPTRRVFKLSLNGVLKEGGWRGASLGHTRFRGGLVIAEVGLALILLIGAALMFTSFVRLQQVNAGFNPADLLTAEIAMPDSRYSNAQRLSSFYHQLLDRAEALPGVRSAALASGMPPDQMQLQDTFTIEGRPTPPGESDPLADFLFVSGSYFRTLGIPILEGRTFSDADRPGSPLVVIINQALARRFFANQNPIGMRLRQNRGNPWMQIVGVVGDVSYGGLSAHPIPALYVPYLQHGWPGAYLMVRAAREPLALSPSLRRAVWSLDRELPVIEMETAEQRLQKSVAGPRFQMLLIGAFAFLALSLAIIGIYGVISYSTAQRTREVGIRVALGATQVEIMEMVLGHALLLSLAGIALGLAGALALTRFLSSLLYGVKPTDPLTFVAVSLILIAVALAACYIPARRASRVDPMVALRYE